MTKPIQDNQDSVMSALDPSIPLIIREAMEHGMWAHTKSQELDPDGHADYTQGCRSSMISDRIAAALRQLVDTVNESNPSIQWQYSENMRATELIVSPFFNIRVKRVKRNRGDRSANVKTARQRRIRQRIPDVLGQELMDFPGKAPNPHEMIWLTAAFDLDPIEELIERAWIGVELNQGFIWRHQLDQPDSSAIASISPPIADHIEELRRIRA